MKKAVSFIVFVFVLSPFFAHSNLQDFYFTPQRRALIFVEDYYALYRKDLYHNSQNHLANVYYLKIALKKAKTNRWWAHPSLVFSYARYNWPSSLRQYTEAHHAKYKELLKMRITLLLTKSYLSLGARYDKENIYWFNAANIETIAHKDHYLIRGFRIARTCYKEAAKYFLMTKEYVRALEEDRYYNKRLYGGAGILYKEINMDEAATEIAALEDEVYKIYHGGSMLEEEPLFLKDKKVKLKIDEAEYKKKVKIYKEERKYYNKEAYPLYNYSKVIREKLSALKIKEDKVNKLITYLKELKKKK